MMSGNWGFNGSCLYMAGSDKDGNLKWTPVEPVKPMVEICSTGIRINGVDIGKEEKNMNNEVLQLYYERKRDEIEKKYNDLYEKDYNEIPVVKEYKEVVAEFETTLVQLADKYNNEENTWLEKTGYEPDYTYELSGDLIDNFKEKYCKERNRETRELNDLVEEIKAQLSLSSDKDYQVEVLKRYGILDKSGKMTV